MEISGSIDNGVNATAEEEALFLRLHEAGVSIEDINYIMLRLQKPDSYDAIMEREF